MSTHLGTGVAGPLDGVVRRHGATMTVQHGRSVAAHFGSAGSEAAVCRSTVGIADRCDRSTLELRGSPSDLELAFDALAPMGTQAWSIRPTPRRAVVRCEALSTDGLTAIVAATEAVSLDVSDRYAAIEVVGPHARELIAALGRSAGPAPMVLRESDDAFELLTDSAAGGALWDELLHRGRTLGVACVGLEALEHLAVSQRLTRRRLS